MKKKRLKLKNKNNEQLIKELQKYEEDFYLKKDAKKEAAQKNFLKIFKAIRKKRKNQFSDI